jgi:alpha-L-fucosidase 2
MKSTFNKALFAIVYLICASLSGPGSVLGAPRDPLPAPKDPGRCRLFHLQPAKEWVDGYPLGNGTLGAMVLGGISEERVALNHSWLWRRAAERRTIRVADKLPEFRRLFLADQFGEAGRLMEKDIMTSGGKMYPYVNPYQPLGDLLLDFSGSSDVKDYQRQLDMDAGIAEVRYRAGHARFRREYFMAAPQENVLVIRVTAEGSTGISGLIRLTRTERLVDFRTHETMRLAECQITNEVAGNLLVMGGSFQEGFPFAAVARVTTKGGTISPRSGGFQGATNAALCIREAHEILIVVAMATGHESPRPVEWCKAHLAALRLPYKTLRQRHVQDYQQLFHRVRLSLDDSQPERPTDQLIEEAVRSRQASPALLEGLFDFGRYLLISGSRPGGLPMNLQGIWNDQSRPPWDCDYHMDLNLEFNYWLAEVCNLSELHQPLFDWAEARIPDGQKQARDLYGCRGIYFPIVADATGLGNADNLTYSWPGTAGWLAQHFWRHWEYTADRDFLARHAYPFLKEVAAFYLDYFTKDALGNYVLLPSVSPENGIKGRTGWTHFTTLSSTIDLEIAREVFTHLLQASEILKLDADEARRWREVLRYLPMPVVTEQGRLSEWSEKVEAEDPAHRHLSPLYGLFPGDRISSTSSPQWLPAARKLLEYRLQFGGGSANGWSYPWRAALFARLGEGDKALAQLDDLARSCVNDNLLSLITDWRGQGLTANWFGTKKVFQIEAGLATPAAMAEMLMQSQGGCIRILPALPGRWPAGRVEGLVARGGFVTGIVWKQGHVERIVIHSRLGQLCRLKVDLIPGTMVLSSSGRPVAFETHGDGVIEFQTRSGRDYELRVLGVRS